MKNFGDAERKILDLMAVGTKFEYDGDSYTVILSGKPTCHKGEPKTDVYILAHSKTDRIEIKISYKKGNADFLENKISAERAMQIFGEDWDVIIEQSTLAIKEKFEERALIYQNACKGTEKGAMTLGWKFELINKKNGELSGRMHLTEEQVTDVYAGSNLSEDKRNAMVGDEVIENSGVANFVLMDEDIATAQDIINKMVPIREYVKMHPEIYFACKALNYRTFKDKWDGNRALSVQVDWKLDEGKLKSGLVFDKPLIVKGNEVGNRLKGYMESLQVKTTDELNENNADTDKMV